MKKHVKKIMILVATVVIICAISIVASAETYGVLEYEIVNDEVTITGVVEGVTGDVYIPDAINGYTVTGIGERAFMNNWKTENIYFPDTIKYLGHHFFLGSKVNFHIKDIKKWCDAEYIYTSGGFEMRGGESFKFYYEGKLIEDLVIPYGVTEIKDYAFWYLHHQLKSVEIPNTVERIGDYAFFWCSPQSVHIPDSVKYIGERALSCSISNRDVTVPESVEYIGYRTLDEWHNVKNIYILNPECIIDGVDENSFSYRQTIYSHIGFAVEEFANKHSNKYDFKSMHYINGEWVEANGKEINNSCEYCKKLQKEDPFKYISLLIVDFFNAIARFFKSFI